MPERGFYVGQFSFPLQLLPQPLQDTVSSLELPVSFSSEAIRLRIPRLMSTITGYGGKSASPRLEGRLQLILTLRAGSVISDLIHSYAPECDGTISIACFSS